MSRSCRILLPAGQLPASGAVQAGLKSLGYRLDLEGLDLADASGFQGCVLDGEDAGFSVARDDEGLTLRWSGDPREQCAALMLARALQTLTDAAVSIGGGAPVQAAALGQRVSELLEEM